MGDDFWVPDEDFETVEDQLASSRLQLKQLLEVRSRYENQLLAWQQIAWTERHPRHLTKLRHLEQALIALNQNEQELLRNIKERSIQNFRFSPLFDIGSERLQSEYSSWKDRADGLVEQYAVAENMISKLTLELKFCREDERNGQVAENQILYYRQPAVRIRRTEMPSFDHDEARHSKYASRSAVWEDAVTTQVDLLSQGRYEEAEHVSLNSHDDSPISNDFHISVTKEKGSSSRVLSFRQKLALEKRLALIPREISQHPHGWCQRWEFRIGVLEIVNLPRDSESAWYSCCVSLLHPDTQFDRDVDHIAAQLLQSLDKPMSGIANMEGYLKVKAMGTTSAVQLAGNSIEWNEAFLFHSRYPQEHYSDFGRPALSLDGTPVVLLITVHKFTGESNSVVCGKLSVLSSEGAKTHQWYMLYDKNGKAMMGEFSEPTLIRIRLEYVQLYKNSNN